MTVFFQRGDGIGKYVEVLGNPLRLLACLRSTEQSGLTAGAEKVAYIPLRAMALGFLIPLMSVLK